MIKSQTNYRPEIDGLRAVAIISVVFCHAKLGAAGGFVGVDVFFVISGFLITSLLLKDFQSGKLDLRSFWERRIRRIVPALVVVTLATLIAGWFSMLPADYIELAESVAAQICFSSNFHFWLHTNYFDGGSELKPLLHTWSLAVEEQFYLLFPVVALGLMKIRRPMMGVAVTTLCVGLIAMSVSEICSRPRVLLGYSMYSALVFGSALIPKRMLGLAFVLAGVGSFVLSVDGANHHPATAFYLLPFRAWELGLGAIVAACPRKIKFPIWMDELLSAIGMGMIMYAVIFYNGATRFPGIAALLPCLGTALVIYTNDVRKTIVGRFLSIYPFVFIGLVSYSLYLWHWPILVFANYWALAPLSLGMRLSLIALSIGLAILCWRYVETPFRQRRCVASRSGIFCFAGIVGIALLAVSLSIESMRGVRSRLPAGVLKYADFQFDVHRVADVEVSLHDARAGIFVPLGSTRPEDPLNVFVWGDSHAKVIMPIVDELCRKHSMRACAAVHSATAPVMDYILANDRFGLGIDAPAFALAVLNFIQSHQIKDVILVARWAGYGIGKLPEFHDGFKKTIAALREYGVRVWVVKDVPMFPWNVPKALAGASLFGGDPGSMKLPRSSHAVYLTELGCQESEFMGASEMGIHILEPWSLLSVNGEFFASKNGMALYRDKEHLTTYGAALLRPMFAKIFEP